MSIFCDTSILVSALERTHPDHARAFPILQSVASGSVQGHISTHSLAETYTTLTRLPIQPRVHQLEAKRLLEESVLPYFDTVPILQDDYLRAIDRISRLGLAGPRIYDLLLLGCAEKCGAEKIFTHNGRDLRALAPPELIALIYEP